MGAATLFANSTAILTLNFPPEERGRVLGLRATATYLGLTTGPFLGGWLAGVRGHSSATALFEAVDVGFLVAAGVAAAGVLSSAAQQRAVRP